MKILMILPMIICVIILTYGCLSDAKEKLPWFGLPELAVCSCDSAYRCISDNDWMRLVAYDQQVKHGKDYHE